MKKNLMFLILVTACAATIPVFAQTPYDSFEPEQAKKEILIMPSASFNVSNPNKDEVIGALSYDASTLTINLMDVNKKVIGSIQLNPNGLKWTTMDPLAEKYYSVSPYAYCGNNPIKYVDLHGDSLTLKGNQKVNAYEQIQDVSKNELSLSMNSSGTVTAQQTVMGPLTMASQSLLTVCNSSNVLVNVTATDATRASSGNLMAAGSFMGNTLSSGPSGFTAIANQEVNPAALDRMSSAFGRPSGSDMLHEVSEAYQGGLISLNSGASSLSSSNQFGSVYGQAHIQAYPSSGRLDRQGYDSNNNPVPIPQASKIYYFVFPNGIPVVINSIQIR